MKLVLIEWTDSSVVAGWVNPDDIDREPMICHSVGWLVHDGEHAKVLAGSANHHNGSLNQTAGIVTIPVVSILNLQELMVACTRVPAGWRCTKENGHDGACAARPVTPADDAAVDFAAAFQMLTNCDMKVAEHAGRLFADGIDKLVRRG